jgi:DNA processing protein
VSGFAYGVDIVAHQFAMEYKLQTIGVVAHGLNQIYPKPHKNMWPRWKRMAVL